MSPLRELRMLCKAHQCMIKCKLLPDSWRLLTINTEAFRAKLLKQAAFGEAFAAETVLSLTLC